MKKIFTIILLTIFSLSLFAQKFVKEWEIPLEGMFGERTGLSVITTTADNNLFIAGLGTRTGYGNLYFMKLDTTGEEIFTTFAEEQYNSYRNVSHVIIDNQNNFAVIGYYDYHRKTYFTQLSEDGEILNTTISGEQYGYQDGYDIEQTIDSNYIVSTSLNDYYSHYCLALRILDKTGDFLWDTAFLDTSHELIKGSFAGMAKINDSTFVLTGYRAYYVTTGEESDMIFAKVQLSNDIVHMLNLKVYQKEGSSESGKDILILPNEQGYIISGDAPNNNEPSNRAGTLTRIDIDGNIVWERAYARSSYGITSFSRIHLDSDTNIIVLAMTGGGSSDATLLKYSLSGDLLHKKHFDDGGNETPSDFVITASGKIYVTIWSGNSSMLLKVKDICPLTDPIASINDTLPKPGADITVTIKNTNMNWVYSLVQINSEETLDSHLGNGENLSFTVSGLTNDDVSNGIVVSVIEPDVDCIKYSDTLYLEFYDGIDEWSYKRLLIVPNPFHNYITISAINANELPNSARVYNLDGQLFLEINHISSYKKIDLSTLEKGVYIIGLQAINGDIIYKKIVKY